MKGSELAKQLAIELIKRYEGLRLEAYRDPAGVWTIGYGHTGPVRGKPLGPGVTITRAEAEQMLRQRVDYLTEKIQNKLQRPAQPHELAALISFSYNVGLNALFNSSLWKAFQRGDRRQAALEFGKWVRAGTQILPGLVQRRLEEALLFRGAYGS